MKTAVQRRTTSRTERLGILIPLVSLMFLMGGTAFAQYASTNYKSNEILFGFGGGNASSTSYQAQQSLGSLGVGRSSSTQYQTYPGPITPETPFLEFVVNTASVNIGVISTSAPATGTATFQVKTYLASGYVVTTNSVGPVNGSHTMNLLASPTVSSAGSEQFGINLVLNSSCPQTGMPGSLGADPVRDAGLGIPQPLRLLPRPVLRRGRL